MKKFVSGIIIGIMLSMTIVYAAYNLTAVPVNFPVYVGGVLFDNANPAVTINSTTYIPIKPVGDALGIKVEWDNYKKCLEIGERPKPVIQSSISDPVDINTPLIIDRSDIFSTYKAEVTVIDIVRGEQADKMVKGANMLNKEAPLNYEYLLAKVNFKLLDIADGKALDLSGSMFDLISSEGKEYGYQLIVAPEPTIQTKLYEGSSNEGWIAFIVGKNDAAPKITFGRAYDGTGGSWFKAYK